MMQVVAEAMEDSSGRARAVDSIYFKKHYERPRVGSEHSRS